MDRTFTKNDLMKIAIEEHLKSNEFPRVGCVIAKDGKVLSTGFRGERKGIHAERVAIEKLSYEKLIGAELYTTLEPCIALHSEQEVESCADLIIRSGIDVAVIGVLDPNGTIYSQGYRKLLDNNISVSFFNRKLREAVEENSFEYGDIHTIFGNGKRRFPVINSGTELNIKLSENDSRAIKVRWASIQYNYGLVDLIGNNGDLREASGARDFSDISDPLIFRHPSHFVRMKKNTIAIVQPKNATFHALIQIIDIFQKDILFKWEVRNNR
ncbi:TPA: cytidine deaminase [Citrobacter werkmanii]